MQEIKIPLPTAAASIPPAPSRLADSDPKGDLYPATTQEHIGSVGAVIMASGAFAEGDLSLNYISLDGVMALLKGRRIESIKFVDDHIVKILLDNGTAVSFTPGGIEGDSQDLIIER